ncbi:MAG: acetolactate synthase small subunit [bacterium]
MKTDNATRRHTITALVDNQPGVLARVVGLISGRGYNIESLNVGPTQDPSISRITMQVPGDDRVLEQVTKQLNKQIDVLKVTDLTKEPFLNRECVLLKVTANRRNRADIIEIADVSGAKVIAVQPGTMVLQLVGDQQQISDFMDLMKPFKVVDVSRSGVIAMGKE